MDPRQKDFDERHTRLPTVTALTKRECFAAMAMQGLLANPELFKVLPANASAQSLDIYSKAAIEHADDLLKQLES